MVTLLQGSHLSSGATEAWSVRHLPRLQDLNTCSGLESPKGHRVWNQRPLPGAGASFTHSSFSLYFEQPHSGWGYGSNMETLSLPSWPHGGPLATCGYLN